MTQRTLFLAIAGCVVALWGAAARQPDLQEAAPPLRGRAPIGDIEMYYEIHGKGDAIVFIHGGGGSVHTSWPLAYVHELSRTFRVVMADSRGHGQSSDGAGPITFGRLAFDTVRLLDHLGIQQAHIIGHSAGAIAGLHLLIDFPDRVKTAMLLAGAYHVDNYRPEAYADLAREVESVIRGENPTSRLASRPLPVLKKLQHAWLAGPSFSLRLLETITRPTLVVTAGQDTFFDPAIGRMMHAHIKGSELIHYPAATHRVQVTNSSDLIPAIRDFIARRGHE